MRFIASYKHRDNGAAYYRTIDADTINEAIKLAERMTRRGYSLTSCTQQLGND